MEANERNAVAALSMMAAFADGSKTDAERDSLRKLYADFGSDDLALVSRRVLSGETSLEAEAAKLATPEAKSMAYEMAVAVCDADGATNDAERAFLERLRAALALDAATATAVREQADRMAEAPHAGSPAVTSGPAPATLAIDDAEVDRSILNYSILTGALELLPPSVSTLSIIPIQMKMVYEIGKRHGYTLDRGHVQDFLATAGVGLTGQVLENVARKLIGGIGRAAGGGLLGGLLGTASGVAVTFGTTWALGQVARTYYAGGRRLDVPALRSLFQSKLAEARNLYPRHQSEIQEKARTVDVSQLVSTLRS